MDSSLPKYLNSAETAVYVKGRHLFGLNFSKEAIRDNDFAVVVEGYLDCIVPFQEGFKNIVASCGTAFTEEQARLLGRYTRNVVVVFDGDSAGELAALRSLDILVGEEMEVKVAVLPQGFDPDLLVRQRGIAAFREVVAKARGLFDYKLGVLRQKFGLKDAQSKAKICASMLETISKFKNAIVSSEYIKKLAQELEIREEALLQEFSKQRGARSAPAVSEPPVNKPREFHPAEKLLVKLMLDENEFIRSIKARVAPDDFKDELISRMVSFIYDLAEQGKEVRPHALMHHFNDEHVNRIVCESVFLPEGSTSEHKEKMVEDCIRRLKDDKIRHMRQRLQKEISAAQQAGDEGEVYRLMEEFYGLIKIEGAKK
jgi:DNA primase